MCTVSENVFRSIWNFVCTCILIIYKTVICNSRKLFWPFLKVRKSKFSNLDIKMYVKVQRKTISNTHTREIFCLTRCFSFNFTGKRLVELHNIRTVKWKLSSKRKALHLKKTLWTIMLSTFKGFKPVQKSTSVSEVSLCLLL